MGKTVNIIVHSMAYIPSMFLSLYYRKEKLTYTFISDKDLIEYVQ